FSRGVNTHNILNYSRKIDRRLSLLNGLLMLFVVLSVFNTSLVANHIAHPDASVAATVYAGTFFVLAIVWNGLWWYCTSGRRLLGRNVTDQQASAITRQYRVAPISYGVALLIAPFSGLASVAVILAVAGFLGITATIGESVCRGFQHTAQNM